MICRAGRRCCSQQPVSGVAPQHASARRGGNPSGRGAAPGLQVGVQLGRTVQAGSQGTLGSMAAGRACLQPAQLLLRAQPRLGQLQNPLHRPAHAPVCQCHRVSSSQCREIVVASRSAVLQGSGARYCRGLDTRLHHRQVQQRNSEAPHTEQTKRCTCACTPPPLHGACPAS